MKRLALTILARTLTDTDVRRLRDLFTAMDLNKDGRIDAVDLHDALDKVWAAARLLWHIMHAGQGAWCYQRSRCSCLAMDCVAQVSSALRAATACALARPTCSTFPPALCHHLLRMAEHHAPQPALLTQPGWDLSQLHPAPHQPPPSCPTQVGAAVDDDELRDLFHASVTDDSGTIDYEQFIAAMLDSNRVARRKDAVRTSFEQLDLDGDGFITVEDLCRLLPNSRSRRSIDLARSMVEEVDKNHDGRVDYQEFSEMMNTPEPNVSSSVHLVQHGTSSRRNSSTYGGEASRPGSLLKGGSGVASSFGSGASHVVSAASASGAANGDHAIAAAAAAAIAASPEPAAGAAEGGASSQEGSALQQPVPLAGGGLVPVA
jgi:Ca2+-binding EF-hand superfamily protein